MKVFPKVGFYVLFGALSAGVALSAHASDRVDAKLYKDRYCGCCNAYADYLDDNGFKVERINHGNMEGVKRSLKTDKVGSCHSTIIDGYVVEGHVPAAAIHKLLSERPDIQGIALPGMPVNSPGMGPEKPGSLQVLSVERDGRPSGVFVRL